MTRGAVLVVALLGAASTGSAQQATGPRLLLVPAADSVFVYVIDPPAGASGFVVYRGRAGETAALVSATPLRGVREPSMAAGIIGEDLPMVMRALRASDESQMFRRLQADRFAAGVLSMVSRNVATVLGRLYVDTGLTAGSRYAYRVVFTDAAGREGDQQVAAQVTVTDPLLAPPAPGRARGGDGEVRIGWTYARYRPEAPDPVIGFHVYRADGSAGRPQRLTLTPVLRNDAAPLEYRDQEARNGVSYRYQVTAVSVLGRESAPSAPIAAGPADRTPPAAPTGLAVEVGDGVVLVVWRLSPEPDVAGYAIERATGLNAPYRRLNTQLLAADAPTWTDSTVSGGHQYFYRALATDAAGNASEPSNAISALPTDRTPPAPPGAVTAAVLARRAIIRWTASPTRAVLGYYIYRGDSTGVVRLSGRPVSGSEFVDSGFGDSGLVPGRTYRVQVSAVDSAFNESPKVSAELHVPDNEAPRAPGGFQARSVLGRFAELSWTPSSSGDVRSYVLARSTGSGAAAEVGRYAPPQTSARDTTVLRGRSYVYRLTAIDSAGNVSAAQVDSLAFADPVPPPAPRYVAARAAVRPATGIEVTWERVASTDLAGYVVFRSTSPTGVYERLTAQPLSVLRFVDTAGRAGLYYQVRAADASHNLSAPSPVASVPAR